MSDLINYDSKLLAWYPLTEKYKSNDISGNDLHGTFSGATIGNGGKLGTCMACTANNQYIELPVTPRMVGKNNKASVCFWIYNGMQVSSETADISVNILKNQMLSDLLTRKAFTLFLYNRVNALHLSMSSNNTSLNISYIIPKTIIQNRWSHIICTVDCVEKMCKTYINGTKIDERSIPAGTVFDSDIFYKLGLVDANSVNITASNLKYNDLRFYTDVLTEKEIKEIYKCKVIDYDFNDPYIEPTENKATHSVEAVNGNGLTINNVGNENGYQKYSISGTWTKGSYPYMCIIGNYIINKSNVNTIYSMSANIYTSCLLKFVQFGVITAVNDAHTNGDMINKYDINTGYTTCIRYHSQQFIDIRSSNNIYLFSQPNPNQVFDPTKDFLYVKDVMCEWKDHYTPYELSTREGIIPDNSGFGNNGTINLANSPSWMKCSDVPITSGSELVPAMGTGCMKIKGTSQYMNHPNPFKGQTVEQTCFTVNCWCLINSPDVSTNTDWSKNYTILINNFCNRMAARYYSRAAIAHVNGNGWYTYFNDNVYDKWVMYTFTVSNIGRVCDVYRNGIKGTGDRSEEDITILPLASPDNIILGRVYESENNAIYIAKYEVYASVLDDETILDIYQQKVNLSNKGELTCDEFIEDDRDLVYVEDGKGSRDWFQNLIPNGWATYGDATNFPGFTLRNDIGIGDQFGRRTFSKNIGSTRYAIDIEPKIELYPDCRYRMELSSKSSNNVSTSARCWCYVGFKELDKCDRYIVSEAISAENYDSYTSNLQNSSCKTTLAQPLNTGDTWIYLTSITGLVLYPDAYKNYMVVCDNPDYPNYEVGSLESDNRGVSAVFSEIDATNKRVKISPWKYSNYSTGTKIARTYGGSTHFYALSIQTPYESSTSPASCYNISRDIVYPRKSARYAVPFIWLNHNATSGVDTSIHFARLSLVNLDRPQEPPTNYNLEFNKDGIIKAHTIQESFKYGRNYISIRGVTLPTSDEYWLSGMYKNSNNKYMDILNQNADGTRDIKIPIWCDYINGELYMRIFRHNNHAGMLLYPNKESAKFFEIDDIFAERYSILGLLKYFKNNDNKFHLLLKYPHEHLRFDTPTEYYKDKYNEWKQTSNPIDTGTITGYEPIHIDMAGLSGAGDVELFAGLGLSETQNTLLDGNGSSAYWHYAIGGTVNYSGGLPGGVSPNGGAANYIKEDSEVWIKVEPFLDNYLERMTLSLSGDLSIAGELKETNTLNAIGTENQTILDLRNTNAVIDNKVYGIEIDYEANTVTRIGDAASIAVSDFNNISPWRDMKRVVIEGQTMVEIPNFYYKTEVIKSEANPNGPGTQVLKERRSVSSISKPGFKPAFNYSNGVKSRVYIGAYEGTLSTDNKLESVTGKQPLVSKNKDEFRNYAKARNTGSLYDWGLQDFIVTNMVQYLFYIEYCSLNSQTALGRGVVDATAAMVTGGTSSLGNLSGSASGTNGLVSVSYRGIENLWDNIWKWVDGGIVENNSKCYAYITNDRSKYSSNLPSDYTIMGPVAMVKTSGYTTRISYNNELDYSTLPTAVGGNATDRFGDYFYQNNTTTAITSFLLGGRWNDSSAAGFACWNVLNASDYQYRNIGGRLFCLRS